jgi:hypothetical protein
MTNAVAMLSASGHGPRPGAYEFRFSVVASGQVHTRTEVVNAAASMEAAALTAGIRTCLFLAAEGLDPAGAQVKMVAVREHLMTVPAGGKGWQVYPGLGDLDRARVALAKAMGGVGDPTAAAENLLIILTAYIALEESARQAEEVPGDDADWVDWDTALNRLRETSMPGPDAAWTLAAARRSGSYKLNGGGRIVARGQLYVFLDGAAPANP